MICSLEVPRRGCGEVLVRGSSSPWERLLERCLLGGVVLSGSPWEMQCSSWEMLVSVRTLFSLEVPRGGRLHWQCSGLGGAC